MKQIRKELNGPDCHDRRPKWQRILPMSKKACSQVINRNKLQIEMYKNQFT
jgi:hypothetical protein